MSELIRFAINICILVIITSIVATVTENMKNGRLVRSAAAVMMIVVTLNFILSFDLKRDDLFTAENYKVDKTEVWDSALTSVENQLADQMLSVCQLNNLSVDKIIVNLETDYQNIQINCIDIEGADARDAKNLIAGYFKIGLAYINIDGV